MKHLQMPDSFNRPLAIACLAISLCVFAASSRAAVPQNLVQAELLADTTAIKPGQPFTLAVRLHTKEGWHTYWKYPGDSGLPTKIKWNLPTGFTAGDLQFPIPTEIDLPGNLINYGYEGDVTLLTQLTPPKDLPIGTPIDIEANVSWLVCEKVCIQGKATLKLQLPVTDAAPPANTEIFAAARSQMPITLQTSPPAPEQWAKLGIKDFDAKSSAHGAFTVRLQWMKPPSNALSDVHWFPNAPPNSQITDAVVKLEKDAAAYIFKLTPPPKNPVPVGFLVTYTDETGKRQAVEFTVELPVADSK